jgi:Helix-turn-helix
MDGGAHQFASRKRAAFRMILALVIAFFSAFQVVLNALDMAIRRPRIRRRASFMIRENICRPARGLLGWPQQQLAAAARVGVVTVRQFETGGAQPRNATLEVICALKGAGVIFIAENGEGPGVRLRKGRG